MPPSKNQEHTDGSDRQRGRAKQEGVEGVSLEAVRQEAWGGQSECRAVDERRLLRADTKLLMALKDYKEESYRYAASPTACLEIDGAINSRPYARQYKTPGGLA